VGGAPVAGAAGLVAPPAAFALSSFAFSSAGSYGFNSGADQAARIDDGRRSNCSCFHFCTRAAAAAATAGSGGGVGWFGSCTASPTTNALGGAIPGAGTTMGVPDTARNRIAGEAGTGVCANTKEAVEKTDEQTTNSSEQAGRERIRVLLEGAAT
jgi:hypothetical protein